MRIGFDDGDLAMRLRGFKQELRRAQRTAGRKIGGQIVRAQRQRLAGTVFKTATPARKKAVQARIWKNGTLCLYDHAPGAKIHETGGTITAGGRWMLVSTEAAYAGAGLHEFGRRRLTHPQILNQLRAQGEIVVLKRRGQLLMFRKQRRFVKNRRLRERPGKAYTAGAANDMVLIAVLKKAVTLRARLKFRETVARFVPAYVAAVEQTLIEGF